MSTKHVERAAEALGREVFQDERSSWPRGWTTERRDEEGIRVRDEGSVSYSAAIGSAATRDTDLTPSEFTLRVERKAQRRGFERAQRRIVLGDAPWIWNIANKHFPDAVR